MNDGAAAMLLASEDPGGFTYPELKSLLEILLSHSMCVGMEITILDPDLDPDARIVKEFSSETGSVISRSLSK